MTHVNLLFSFMLLTSVALKEDSGKAEGNTFREVIRMEDFSTEDFYNAFGFYAEENILKIKESNDIYLRNFLVENNISASVRTLFLKTSPCGSRSFQFVSRMDKKLLREYVITYQCDNSCVGLVEKEDKRVSYLSAPVELPESLCKIFWGGSVKLKDGGSL